MTNKCVVVGCKTGENKKKRKRNHDVLEVENDDKNDDETTTKKKKSMFHFPPKDNEELRQKWVKFVCRENWKPSDSSVVCSDHFDTKYLIPGKQRTRLNQELDPVPDIYPDGYAPYHVNHPLTAENPMNFQNIVVKMK
jgi:hypothetical protein